MTILSASLEYLQDARTRIAKQERGPIFITRGLEEKETINKKTKYCWQ